MDHAKALADALRDLVQTINSYSCPYRVNDEARIAGQALAAYESHPAEAATRENGDLLAILKSCQTQPRASIVENYYTPAEALAAMRLALSTHQQQGAEQRVAWLESLFDFSDPELVMHHAPNDPVTKDAYVVRASYWDAVRVPQPDTEEQIDAEFERWWNMDAPDTVTGNSKSQSREGYIAGRRAALAVRGKVE